MPSRLKREDDEPREPVPAPSVVAPAQQSPVDRVLAMQRGAGNAAVAQMLGGGHGPIVARLPGDQAAPPGLVPAIAALEAVITALLAGGNALRVVTQAESKLQMALTARAGGRVRRTGLDDALEAARAAVRAARGSRAGATVDGAAVAALTGARDALRGHLPAPAPQPAPAAESAPEPESPYAAESAPEPESPYAAESAPESESSYAAESAPESESSYADEPFSSPAPAPSSAPASSSAIDWDAGSWIPNISTARPAPFKFPKQDAAAGTPFRPPPPASAGSSYATTSSESPYHDRSYAGNVPSSAGAAASPPVRVTLPTPPSLGRGRAFRLLNRACAGLRGVVVMRLENARGAEQAGSAVQDDINDAHAAFFDLADKLTASGAPPEAVASVKQAIELLTKLMAVNPGLVKYKDQNTDLRDFIKNAFDARFLIQQVVDKHQQEDEPDPPVAAPSIPELAEPLERSSPEPEPEPAKQEYEDLDPDLIPPSANRCRRP